MLVQYKGSRKFKGWNVYMEFFSAAKVDHNIRSLHSTQRRGKQTTRAILVLISWIDDGFFANHPRAIDILRAIVSFHNFPVAC